MHERNETAFAHQSGSRSGQRMTTTGQRRAGIPGMARQSNSGAACRFQAAGRSGLRASAPGRHGSCLAANPQRMGRIWVPGRPHGGDVHFLRSGLSLSRRRLSQTIVDSRAGRNVVCGRELFSVPLEARNAEEVHADRFLGDCARYCRLVCQGATNRGDRSGWQRCPIEHRRLPRYPPNGTHFGSALHVYCPMADTGGLAKNVGLPNDVSIGATSNPVTFTRYYNL